MRKDVLLHFLSVTKKTLKLHLCLVLKLATPVSLSTYTPVCLPPSGVDFSGMMRRDVKISMKKMQYLPDMRVFLRSIEMCQFLVMDINNP
jgi:hypothetical protein